MTREHFHYVKYFICIDEHFYVTVNIFSSALLVKPMKQVKSSKTSSGVFQTQKACFRFKISCCPLVVYWCINKLLEGLGYLSQQSFVFRLDSLSRCCCLWCFLYLLTAGKPNTKSLSLSFFTSWTSLYKQVKCKLSNKSYPTCDEDVNTCASHWAGG